MSPDIKMLTNEQWEAIPNCTDEASECGGLTNTDRITSSVYRFIVMPAGEVRGDLGSLLNLLHRFPGVEVLKSGTQHILVSMTSETMEQLRTKCPRLEIEEDIQHNVMVAQHNKDMGQVIEKLNTAKECEKESISNAYAAINRAESRVKELETFVFHLKTHITNLKRQLAAANEVIEAMAPVTDNELRRGDIGNSAHRHLIARAELTRREALKTSQT